MEPGDYINSSVNERTESHSGRLKLYGLVGASFGLLCVIQAAFNVSLWLRAAEFHNKNDNISNGNFTPMSADDNSALIFERDRLLQDKHQLAKEKKELEDNNKMLNEKVNELHNLIKDLQTKREIVPSCPQGWKQYMSNCYHRSYTRRNWTYAEQDCVNRGAHLVILNDQVEEDVVLVFGGAVRMWIGLSYRKDTLTRSLTWVDQSEMTFPNWKKWEPDVRSSLINSCVYLDQASSWWSLSDCQRNYYWMCEKELNNRST